METLVNWSLSGVDFHGPGNNGGLDCRDHVSPSDRLIETVIGITIGLLSLMAGRSAWTDSCRSVSCPFQGRPERYGAHFSLCRVSLLAALSFVFGLEVSFKFSSRQLVFLLNPCHVCTVLQLYLLAVPVCLKPALNRALYELMLHYAHGPLTAVLFPVTECLHLPFEKATFWLQHGLLVLVPLYLVLTDGCYHRTPSSSRLLHPAWLLSAYGVWCCWHWLILHSVAYFSLVNVGSMLCPAASDPFASAHYRLLGMVHQLVAIATMCAAHKLLAVKTQALL